MSAPKIGPRLFACGISILCNHLAIFGGLLYILTFGSGTISLDKRERKREIL